MLQLVICFTKDQRTEALMNRCDGGLHCCMASRFRFCFSGDAQRNRCLVNGYTDRRLPATRDDIGQHLLQIALADTEALDLMMSNHTPATVISWEEGGKGDRFAY